MSEQAPPHDAVFERSALDRLQDEWRVLQTVCRMLADDVAEALATGNSAAEVLHSLGVEVDELDETLSRASDLLRVLAT